MWSQHNGGEATVVSRRVNGEQNLPGRESLALIPGQELGMWSCSPQHHLLQLS